MNTATREGKLLVDLETGRVLRADDQVTCTEQYLNSHPFIFHIVVGETDAYFAGPDAFRRAKARASGTGEGRLRATEYEALSRVDGNVSLQKVEWA